MIRSSRVVVGTLGSLALLFAVVPSVSAQAVFINEIHYDNTGTDADEAIEIAGPAGTDLAGWSLVLYNGSNGLSYNVRALSGILPGQQAGFGTLVEAYPTNGIQNGSPDGIALVDPGSTVVQFLSYEGTLTALDGPAAGMTSVDIGVAESSGTPVGFSLQLAGSGSTYPDFAWAPEGPSTYGLVNTNQTFTGGGASDPVINEFVFNHTGSDTFEFVEVRGDAGTDYSSFTVLEIEGDSSGAGVIDGAFPVGTTNGTGHWFTGYLNNTIENGTVTLLLVENFTGSVGTDLDAGNDGVLDATPWDRVVDEVAVTDGGSTDQAYAAVVLAPGFDGGPFTPGGASRIPDGADTDTVADWVRNDFDGAGLPGFPATGDPGEALNTAEAVNEVVPTPPPVVVINEILQNPAAVSDNDGEWFELYNPTGFPVDIEGWTIADNDFDSHTISNGGPLVIPAAGYLVLGNNSDFGTNGGVVVGYQYSGVFLANGSDELVLRDAALQEVDRVEWDNGATFPDPNGASMALASPALDNNVGANWCTSSTPFGDGDLGTPGGANDCPLPELVINEIDYDQPGSDGAEFVEITNTGGSPANLAGLELEFINGSTTSSYQTVALPAASLAPGDYFVVCGNVAAVAECDMEVSGFTIQNGSPDAVALVSGASIVDTVSYEGDVPGYTEGSGAGLADSGGSGQDFKGISRVPDGVDSDQNNIDFSFVCITPGAPNTSRDTGCSATGPAYEIWEIQGSGASSPFEGVAVVTLGNVVTAVGPDAFFMQTPAARTDGDVDTSDGIYVFTGGAPGVAVGDEVDVAGVVSEFFGFTEFAFAVVTVTGAAPPPLPVLFDAAVPSPDPTAPSCALEFECYEGMLIEIADGTVTGPNQRFNPDPIAEVHITAASARTFREPGILDPGLPGLPVWDGNPEVFELDPDKLGLPNLIIPAGSSFRAVGALGFEFGGYELWPSELEVLEAPLPVPVPARAPGEFTVASLNLFRLFDDVDDPADVDALGNPRDDFVVSTAEYLRRRNKFAAYILEVLGAPDVLAVQEAEKLGVLQDLAADIAAIDPGVVYTAYLEEGNDIGTIDVGFLVRDTVAVDAITQLGKDETYFNPVDLTFDILHDRPPLLLEGRCLLEFGEVPIAVMTVHQRSLGGIESPTDGPRVREKRLQQANSVADKVQALQSADPGVHLVVTGDFNAFEFTDGYVDVLGRIAGDFDDDDDLVTDPVDRVEPDLTNQIVTLDPGQRYSFIFQGSAQTLDHALTSSALADDVSLLAYGRGNADAAVDLINDDTTFENIPLRSSDHDGLVLYLSKDDDADGVPDDADLCPGTVIPERSPSQGLLVNHFALIDGDGLFDTVAPNGVGPQESFTVGDTGGCSCEQIIEALHLGNGHARHGCSVGVMRNWVDSVQP